MESTKSAALFVGESGRGPWQEDQEIKALIIQLKERECPVIPVALPLAKTTPRLPYWLKVFVMEIWLPGNLDEFFDKESDKFIARLKAFLKGGGEVRVTGAAAGSIRLRLELTPEDADNIYVAAQSGQLADLGISAARLYLRSSPGGPDTISNRAH